MEFLDMSLISLTKDSSILLYAIHSPFYWRIWKKIHVLLILTKKSTKQGSRFYSWRAFFLTKMRIENQTKDWVWVDSSLCPETSTKNAVQESHLWKGFLRKFQLLGRETGSRKSTCTVSSAEFLTPPPPPTQSLLLEALFLHQDNIRILWLAEFWLICINSIWYSPWARIFKLLGAQESIPRNQFRQVV